MFCPPPILYHAQIIKIFWNVLKTTCDSIHSDSYLLSPRLLSSIYSVLFSVIICFYVCVCTRALIRFKFSQPGVIRPLYSIVDQLVNAVTIPRRTKSENNYTSYVNVTGSASYWASITHTHTRTPQIRQHHKIVQTTHRQWKTPCICKILAPTAMCLTWATQTEELRTEKTSISGQWTKEVG